MSIDHTAVQAAALLPKRRRHHDVRDRGTYKPAPARSAISVFDEYRKQFDYHFPRRFKRGAALHVSVLSERPTEQQITATIFDDLARQWSRDTVHLSNIEQVVLSPAYQRIIGLGPAALPLILERLRDAPDPWFWALVAIAREDVAADADTVEGARSAWLQWGRDKGLITDAADRH